MASWVILDAKCQWCRNYGRMLKSLSFVKNKRLYESPSKKLPFKTSQGNVTSILIYFRNTPGPLSSPSFLTSLVGASATQFQKKKTNPRQIHGCFLSNKNLGQHATTISKETFPSKELVFFETVPCCDQPY